MRHSTRLIPAFTAFMILGSGLQSLAQETPAPALPPAALLQQSAMFESMVRQYLDAEIKVVRKVTGINDEQVETIREATKDQIAVDAKQLADQMRAGKASHLKTQISKELRAKLDETLRTTLEPNAFAAYQKDAQLREQFLRKTSQRTALMMMDRLLSLSNQQQNSLAKVLIKSWNDDWNSLVVIALSQKGLLLFREQLKELPDEDLKNCMHDSQYLVLKGMLDLDMQALGGPGSYAELEGGQIRELMIQEMKKLCNLSSTQVQRLQDASGLAVDEIVQEKEEAFAKVRQFSGQGRPDMAAYDTISRPVALMLNENVTWKTGLADTLNDVQMQTLRKRNAIRQKREHVAAASALLIGFGMQLGLTGQQQQAFAKLIVEETKPEIAAQGSIGMSLAMIDIPEAKYSKVLDEDQAAQFKAQIQGMRQQFQPTAKPDSQN